MAGTTRLVKRMWSLFTPIQAVGTAIEDPIRSLYEEHNKLVADVEALRARAIVPPPVVAFSQNSGTDSDLDFTKFVAVDSAGAYRVKAAATITTLPTTTVTATKFGVILWQLKTDGTFDGKVPGATQAYDSVAAAVAAVPAPSTDYVAIAVSIIDADSGDWVANTDDFTSDLDAFTSFMLQTYAASNLTAASLSTIESGD